MGKTYYLLFVFVFICLISKASANYISGDLEVLPDGRVNFDVQTDVPIDLDDLAFDGANLKGTTNLLTSKEGDVWTLNLDFPEYDEIFLQIKFPRNLEEILGIEGREHIIDLDDKIIVIIDSGKLDFSARYILGRYFNYSFIIWPLIALLIILGYYFYKRLMRKKERLKHILPIIGENEQKIIDLLMKEPIRQKALRERLGMPKASFSRYMLNLEKKKLIIREGEGKNKLVLLK